MLKKIFFGLVVSFILIQFYRPERTNPVVEGKSINAPANVAAILERSCYDCHSNNTVWPWYTNIAPVSIFTITHVNDGRKELNFSEWETYNEKRKLKKFKEIVEQVNEGEMPLESYLYLHGNAKLSDEDIATLCEWAKSNGGIEDEEAKEDEDDEGSEN